MPAVVGLSTAVLDWEWVGRRMASRVAVWLGAYLWATQVVLESQENGGRKRVEVPLPSYIKSNLGPYTPYEPVGIYPPPPEQCQITQVNILQRHGARFPTFGAGMRMAGSVNKLKMARSLSRELSFVWEYEYELGADDLNKLGRQESYEAGKEVGDRYGERLHLAESPFVRSDSSKRCVESARDWARGFRESAGMNGSQGEVLVISGRPGSNNTLANHNCPNAPSPGPFEKTWLNIFAADAVDRFNDAAPRAQIVPVDILNYMQLCGFDTEYLGVISPWCELFTEKEWEGFEYYYDLDKMYGNGYGNPLGAVQGVGYVNELLARLHDDVSFATNDRTQVNQTLDSSSATFPIGKPIYADFSHDNEMASILVAMGLKNGPTLTPYGPPEGQVWYTSQILSFSGRLVTERLSCDGYDEPFVRFLINDELQDGSFCGASKDGLCSLSAFRKSQAYSTENGRGDYDLCGYKAP